MCEIQHFILKVSSDLQQGKCDFHYFPIYRQRCETMTSRYSLFSQSLSRMKQEQEESYRQLSSFSLQR